MDISTWNVDYFIKNERDCVEYIKNHINEVPYLNAISLDTIKDEKIVRFRGMIQDMHSSEYYLERCKVTNKDSNNVTFKSGKYRDIIESKEDEIVEQFSRQNVTNERHPLVVVSVPGLNDWIIKFERDNYNEKTSMETSPNKGLKRTHEDDEEQTEASPVNAEASHSENNTKKVCENNESLQEKPQPSVSKEFLLNLPLPDRGGKVCIVKLYDAKSDDFKLNQVYDFIGFLSLDPRMTHTRIEHSLLDDDIETLTHYPPPSLIPRIQGFYWDRIDHVNPLVAKDAKMDSERASNLCKELKLILTEILLGDELAANYLVYHLISTVYLRQDMSVLGKFTLNITNIPEQLVEEFGSTLYGFIELLTTHSHYLPMTLENMNDLTFVPKQDHESNRLTSGVLQLSSDTHLVLDETKMSTGRLGEAGCRAIATLNRLIKDQDLSYDFGVYGVEFQHNIHILIISEGKSMLPSDYHVILQPSDVHVDTYSDIVSAAKKLLTKELLNEFRRYITMSRHKELDIPEDVTSLIEEDFVKFRQTYDIKAEDLHHLLVLARLVAFGDGKEAMDRNSWKTACELEEARWQRVKGM